MTIKPHLSEQDRRKIDDAYEKRYREYVREVEKDIATFHRMAEGRGWAKRDPASDRG